MPTSVIALSVRVLAPLGRDLTYTHDGPVAQGTRVRVPLGQRQVMGVVTGTLETPDNAAELKAIDEVIDSAPLLHAEHLAFLSWASDYYGVGLETLLQSALPKWGRQGRPFTRVTQAWRWNPEHPKPKGSVRQAIWQASQAPISAPARVINAMSDSRTKDDPGTLQIVRLDI